MKIGRLNLTLATADTDAEPDSDAGVETVSTTKPIGASGTINLSGFLQPDEYVNDLRGKPALSVYERMRNDGAVEEALGHMTEPVIAALTDLQIEPASDETIDLYAAELCRCALFEWLDQDLQEFWRQALGMLTFGHSVFEVTEQIVEAPLTIEIIQADGSITQETHPNTMWRVPNRFAHRLQRTIWRWVSFEGKLQEIEQLVFKDDGTYVNAIIPGDDLLVFTMRREGDNYMGRSLLRPAYKPWFMKDIIERTMVVAVDRHGVGLLSAYLPEGMEHDDEMVSRIEDILQNLHAGESNYVVWPYPKAGTTAGNGKGISFEIVSPPGGLPAQLVDMAEYFRGDIKAALLTRFSELGHSSVGARSVGDVQTEVWHRALTSVGGLVCNVLKQRFDRIVAENLPGARCPTIKPGTLESKNLTEFATSIGGLVSSGAIEADQSFREWVRTEVGAPDEDEGTNDELVEEKEAGKNIPPPGTQPPLPGMPGMPPAAKPDPNDPNPGANDGGGR